MAISIKSIQFKRRHFDDIRYHDASNFQKRFLNDPKSLEQVHDIFSVYSQLTDGVPDIVQFKDIELMRNTAYFEMSTFQFYALKDRSWIKDRNIIVTNMYEPWLIGIPFDDQIDMMPLVFDDPTLFDCVDSAKSFTVVIDNMDPRLKERYPNINWVCPNMWHSEAFLSFTDAVSILRAPFIENVNMINYIDANTHNNKEHDFTCLIGKEKPHRLDFWFKLINNSLVEHNIVGSWAKHIINPKYEDSPDQEKDRIIKREWIEKSKIWIALESFPEQQNRIYPITQITEKTFKPIRYGMPFLIHGTVHTLNALEDMGYNTYKEIFGNYIDDDYKTTNDNIVEIIKKIDSYDWHRIREIAKQNILTLQSWDKKKYFESILQQICT